MKAAYLAAFVMLASSSHARADDTLFSKQFSTCMKKSERLWIQYRDANCSFYYNPHGGTRDTLLANDCILQETALRTQELEEFVKFMENFESGK